MADPIAAPAAAPANGAMYGPKPWIKYAAVSTPDWAPATATWVQLKLCCRPRGDIDPLVSDRLGVRFRAEKRPTAEIAENGAEVAEFRHHDHTTDAEL